MRSGNCKGYLYGPPNSTWAKNVHSRWLFSLFGEVAIVPSAELYMFCFALLACGLPKLSPSQVVRCELRVPPGCPGVAGWFSKSRLGTLARRGDNARNEQNYKTRCLGSFEPKIFLATMANRGNAASETVFGAGSVDAGSLSQVWFIPVAVPVCPNLTSARCQAIAVWSTETTKIPQPGGLGSRGEIAEIHRKMVPQTQPEPGVSFHISTEAGGGNHAI